MLIAIGFCALVVWLVFFKFQLLPWNWPWRIITGLTVVIIVGIFIGLLNRYAPSGRIMVLGRVIEVTPNVIGTVTAVPVQTNVRVKSGTILFEIDHAPYAAKVKQLKAALLEAKQKAKQLKASVDVAAADTKALESQVAFSEQRRADTERLAKSNAASEFRLQETTAQADRIKAQLLAARAKEASARLAAESEIEGENTTVVQIAAQLENAQWQLDQATVRAPADGYVTLMALGIGHMATPSRAALSFIVADEIALIGIFPQNGFVAIEPGATVKMVFANQPGTVYASTVDTIFRGVGEGQMLASGGLERASSAGVTTEFPVRIKLPSNIDRDLLRPGVSGKATVFAPNAGVIGALGDVLIRVSAWGAYL
jgi:multidrug resistance efflux pump